ncbi:RlmE family RNA methyltransferase [Polyangium sp. 6x1]|uniref:RlmE family RNA methyltransferase n=1 Tax=Polyangium sp. 6x1 TaxID=3042689 RepID=UPI00248321AF|nr:RlmE family RNA methyltransferase [Polyangium sp. 6x1]MDI1449471.1 RlmE family RNA methyltransferase [Polyangium sp. 6x1]
MSSKGKNPYRKPDTFTKAAKAQGFPARSVFKLEEIDRRVRLLRPGQRVLDLGAAPGSWSMYVAQKIGSKGHLLAVDLSEIRQAFGPNVTVVRGDALSLANEALAQFAPYDVVLSDMAPATTGSKASDQWRSYELFDRAVSVAEALGGPGSSFVGKLFMSEEFQKARERLRSLYDEVRVIRPEGTRSVSSEVFLVGLGRKQATP